MAKAIPRILVVGGGLAGLRAAHQAAERGAHVDLMSIVPVKRSHSVCAQGGINAAVNTKGEGDSTLQHFDDTIYGGDFLAHQPPVKAMCEMAPEVIYLLDRMGVPFNRTPEGLIDFRRFGGTLYHRTAYAGATTGQQLMYALDEQVRRYEAEGRVQKYEGWEMISLVLDDHGVCRGVIAIHRSTMEIRAFRADAVILAVGGIGMIFGRSTNSIINTGSAHSVAYQQGAIYANGEFIQMHPTTIPGGDKLRLMSESIRGEGGRIWVPRKKGDTRRPREIPESERWYFLEEKYPKYGNLVPRDIASREIFKVCVEMGMGVGGQRKVYLDITHLPRKVLEVKLGGVLEIYRKYMGVDPAEEPMEIFPGMHYTMGGLWVDYGMMTNIPGLFAAGECNFQHHGANRLGANSLLSCFYDGFVSANSAIAYAQSNPSDGVPSSIFEGEEKQMKEEFERIYNMRGPENPYRLHQELGELMTDHVTIIRYNDKLRMVLEKLKELRERWERIGLPDENRFANSSAIFTYELRNMIILAEVITLGALLRDESRGAHYKPEFPERNDEKFLKTTLARYTPDGPKIDYEPVDTSYIPPRPRTYEVAG
jgi:succinate dehydrogenase / fumarate reductase flavoprotein subunit